MSEVWVVETVEYEWEHEFRVVLCVATSLDAAVSMVKEQYSAPYDVLWTNVAETGGRWEMTGHFEYVPGFSSRHSAIFDLTPYPLDRWP